MVRIMKTDMLKALMNIRSYTVLIPALLPFSNPRAPCVLRRIRLTNQTRWSLSKYTRGGVSSMITFPSSTEASRDVDH